MNLDDLFTEELINATFLYAFKNIYDKNDVEDLAQSILLEAMNSYTKTTRIVNFYGWYWKVAKNELYRYIGRKTKQAKQLEFCEGYMQVDSMPIQDDFKETNPLSVNMTKIISRLSSEYRNIIILFYLQNYSIKEISSKLQLPVGTVKRRLYEARKKVQKERINMENNKYEYTFSYAIPNLFWAGGFNVLKFYDKIEKPIYRSILTACANEELTINEIADRIDINPIYLEEFINYLTENNILKQNKNKYITNIIMIDQKYYNPMQNEIRNYYTDLALDLIEVLNRNKTKILELNFYGNQFDFEVLKWHLIPYICEIYRKIANEKIKQIFKDKSFSKWDNDWRLFGIITYPEDKPVELVGYTGWSNIYSYYNTSNNERIEVADLFDWWPFTRGRSEIINETNIDLIIRLSENSKLELTEREKILMAELIEHNLVELKQDNFILKAPVFANDIYYSRIADILSGSVYNLVDKYLDGIINITEKHLLTHIRQDLLEQFYNWLLECQIFPCLATVDEVITKKLINLPKDLTSNESSKEFYGLAFIKY